MFIFVILTGAQRNGGVLFITLLWCNRLKILHYRSG